MTATGERPVAVYPLQSSQMAEIVAQAETGYPEEICGIVIGKPGVPDTYQVRQVRNIANQDRQRDSAGFERDARTAYRMDDREVLRVLREADDAGWDVVNFYHSHPDHDAYFSLMDRDRALRVVDPSLRVGDPSGSETLRADKEPLWPGANYLVVSVRRGRAVDARYYIWDEARGDFAEVPATLPGV
ncbi:MAG: Mov34/MPN/PAD-1 family protein [Candidatus Methylomirabilota bacterium]